VSYSTDLCEACCDRVGHTRPECDVLCAEAQEILDACDRDERISGQEAADYMFEALRKGSFDE
jgi:hypothetical protein